MQFRYKNHSAVLQRTAISPLSILKKKGTLFLPLFSFPPLLPVAIRRNIVLTNFFIFVEKKEKGNMIASLVFHF